MQVHHFFPGPHRTWDDRPVCEACGSTEADKVHEVPLPDVPEEARLIDARKIGERRHDAVAAPVE
jgi:hypothetical protein